MTSNYSNINDETKDNIINKMTTTHSICSKFVLDYTCKMLKIYLKNKSSKKLQALLVIPNVIAITVTINEIH